MPKITLKLDIQKDAWNWWHACNHISYSVDWKQRIDQSIWENVHGKSQEDAFAFLIPYLKNNYIKQQHHLELYQKQAEEIIKQNATRACRWLEKITERPLARQDFTLYLTTFPRCPYDMERGLIWVCAIWPPKLVMDILLHELLHFQFYAYYKNRDSVKKLSAAQFEDLKEALTVILNYEFREYLAQSDRGYAVHQKLRQKLAGFWQKNKNFDELVDYGARLMTQPRVLKMMFWQFWLVSLCLWPSLAFAQDYTTIIKETRYIDQYFEVDDQGNAQAYIYLPTGEKIATVNDATSTEPSIDYILSDHLGSPTIITDEQGEVVEINDYEPYGNPNFEETSVDNDYKFTGKEQDKETDLQYFGGRYYNNSLGRFVSIDPATIFINFDLADPQTLNGYSYVTNNPLKYIDPTGAKREDYMAPSQTPTQVGQKSGTYKGVQLYAGNGTVNSQQSQCVTGVQNLYSQLFNVDIRYGLGSAVNYSDLSKASDGAIASYQQGSTVMPQENDIITWSGGGNGHVGMIIEANYNAGTRQGTIYTIEQNHRLNQEVFSYQFNGTPDADGTMHYYVEGFGKNYAVESWQRPANGSTNPAPPAINQPVQQQAPTQQNNTRWYNKVWNSFKNLFSN